jgi:hypothetical protein
MNYRITIGFLVAALAMAVLVFGLDRFNIGPTATNIANATATTTASQQPSILAFDDSKAVAIELHMADQSVRVEKQNDNWVVAGTGEPANRSSFMSLLVRLSQLKATRVVDNPGTDLSQFGLDAPKDRAIAELDDGTKVEIDFGGKTPVQTGIYAKKPDDPTVYVVAEGLTTDLERLVTDPKEPPTPTPRAATPVPPALPAEDTTPTPGN